MNLSFLRGDFDGNRFRWIKIFYLLLMFFSIDTFSDETSPRIVGDESSQSSEPFNELPQLFSRVERPYFLDEAFRYSCGSEGGLLTNKVANNLQDHASVGDHFFFFSLKQYIKDKNKKNEYRFYTTKDFSGVPAYVLDENGLKQNGDLICSWSSNYNEEHLYANYLLGCFGGEPHHVSKGLLKVITDHRWGNFAIHLCSVMGVESYEVVDGKYYLQVMINDKKYYLDTRDMPELADGSKFYSSEKRFNWEMKRRIADSDKLIKMFTKYRSSEHYKNLIDCFAKKDKECIAKSWRKDFFEEVASSGYKAICNNNNKNTSSEGPDCGDYKAFADKITNVSSYYLKNIIEDITFLRIQNFYFLNGFLYYKDPEPHAEMNELAIGVDLQDNSLLLKSFDDGYTC